MLINQNQVNSLFDNPFFSFFFFLLIGRARNQVRESLTVMLFASLHITGIRLGTGIYHVSRHPILWQLCLLQGWAAVGSRPSHPTGNIY